MPQYLEPVPNWRDEEKPFMPGSPSSPPHSAPTRVAYACVALLIGITGGLGTALVSANLLNLQGAMGLTTREAAWLPGAYLVVNVTANLLVFKFRQQFGMRLFAEIGLALYALIALLHLFVDDFAVAILLRAVSGFAGATVSTLTMFYMMQAFPRRYAVRALIGGISVSQMATPLAWLLSPALLDLGDWHSLYRFEAGLAVCAFAAVVLLKLPPGIRIRSFEKLDFLTFALLAPGVALLGAVLVQGLNEWWFQTPWLAYALIGSVLLLATGLLIEHYRANPLVHTRWLGNAATIRFVIGALALRFLLSEQTYGAVGLLRTLGMGPDQLQPLYAVILGGLIAGVLTSALTFSPKAIMPQLLLSAALIAAGSFLDLGVTSQVRPHNMFASQFMVAFASGLFMGPMMILGISQALKNGPGHIVTFSVVFSITQSFAGLAGPAALGTYELFRQHEYSTSINAHIDPTQGVVAQRLATQQQLFAGVITDPVRRQAQGMAQLAQTASREASVRAYDDVFRLTLWLALGFLLWGLYRTARMAMAARRTAAQAAPAQDSRS